jgi:hypothetical protein
VNQLAGSDHQPLLPPGFHEMSLKQLREICVDAQEFRTSRARCDLITTLEAVVVRLRAANIAGELWIGGSFVTTKMNPGDIDASLRLASRFFDTGTKEQVAALIWFTEIYATHRIDGYLHFEFSPSDPRHEARLENYLFWKNFWGHGKNGASQGIAVIQL